LCLSGGGGDVVVEGGDARANGVDGGVGGVVGVGVVVLYALDACDTTGDLFETFVG